VAAGSCPVALAKQKFHFFLLRGNLFDEGDSSGADPGRGSVTDQLDRARRAKQVRRIVFEIAVTTESLTENEKRFLLK
jgi:hypothetical protein